MSLLLAKDQGELGENFSPTLLSRGRILPIFSPPSSIGGDILPHRFGGGRLFSPPLVGDISPPPIHTGGVYSLPPRVGERGGRKVGRKPILPVSSVHKTMIVGPLKCQHSMRHLSMCINSLQCTMQMPRYFGPICSSMKSRLAGLAGRAFCALPGPQSQLSSFRKHD